MTLPLSDIRVLDFTQVVSGAVVTGLLAEFGADVIKVESATRLDPGRRLGPFRPDGPREPDGSLLFASLNRNKRSVAINLRHPDGVAIAVDLVRRCDVIVENFSAGVMARLGLGPDALLASNPSLVYLSMSGLGQSGPRAGWVSFNAVLQALSGLMAITGRPGDPPVMVSNSWADFVAGLHGTVLVLAALARRHTEGKGAYLDMSQCEVNVLPLGHLLQAAQDAGRPVGRWGNRSPVRVPQGCYRCAGEDAWCAISVGDAAQWQALTDVLNDDVLRQPRYRHAGARWEDHDLIDERIERWTRTRRSREVEDPLVRAGVPAAAVRSGVEVWQELRRRGSSVRTLPHPVAGNVPVFAAPIRLNGTAGRAESAGPLLGDHTATVLQQVLGMSGQRVQQLRADGVLV